MTVTDAKSALQFEYDRDPVWGPLSHPALETIEEGRQPWKDHIYIAFWDPKSASYGFLHWNGSPNHPTTKVQANIALGGKEFDLIEELPPQATHFSSDSAEFDLEGTIEYKHERLKGTLTMAPQFGAINYGPGGSIPALADQEPLQHFQSGLTLKGRLQLDGVDYDIDALGFRTRTWGYRDDSEQFPEYFYLWATFDDYAVSVIKHVHPDGRQKTGGALVNETETIMITDVHLPKDRAGFAYEVTVDLEDGTSRTLARDERVWGGWCPIGLPKRNGPTFAAFDEVVGFVGPDNEFGYGLSEYGYIRRVY
ncbi:hypothetical protein P3H15_09685 [Rhodococcus sp. T2V]|uniref:DUF7065 domain-containing protein n=1 Tax=Rhodococcus sp. T2V TaxID=3034164 RepID=UPI0023E24C11|nr:hypothetical protein [Rhodococcus sp. T2V]MDF3305291.1 hypothetical protein [Rhodococcus sp. T2V]